MQDVGELCELEGFGAQERVELDVFEAQLRVKRNASVLSASWIVLFGGVAARSIDAI